MKQVAAGLKFLHERDIVHRDMKPANILYDQASNWKISDLGLAKFMERWMTPETGTPRYFAPEQLQTDYDSKVDVFAFGLIIFEICYPVRDERHHYDCFRALRRTTPQFPAPETRLPYYSTRYDDLIKGMIHRSKLDRTSINDIAAWFGP